MKNTKRYEMVVDACVGAIHKYGPMSARQLLPHCQFKLPKQKMSTCQLASVLRVYGQKKIYGEVSATALNWEHGGYNNVYYLRDDYGKTES